MVLSQSSLNRQMWLVVGGLAVLCIVFFVMARSGEEQRGQEAVVEEVRRAEQLAKEAFNLGFEEGKLYGRPSLGCEWSLRHKAPEDVTLGIDKCPPYKYEGPTGDAIHGDAAGELYDARAHEGCAGRGLWVHYTKVDHKTAIDKALQHMPAHTLQTGSRLLDIGCGCGLKSMEILCRHDVAVYGVDISAQSISWAMKNLPDKRRGLFCHTSANNLSNIPDNYFDGGLSYGSMLYLMHDCTAYSEILRVLKPGAAFYAGWNYEGAPSVPCNPVKDLCIPRKVWTECPGKKRHVEFFTSLDFNGIDKYDARAHYEAIITVDK